MPGGEARLGGTRLGGRPDLPRGMRWPSCRGHRLAFLMQVDLAELALAAPGRVGGSGRLLVFGDLRMRWDGITQIELAHGPVRRGSCVQVRHVTAPPAELAPRRTPKRTRSLRSTPVTLRPTLTIPEYEVAETLLGRRFSEREYEAWSELSFEAAAGALGARAPFVPQHQLLGWAAPVQTDPGYSCGKGRRLPPRQLLLQLDFDERLRFYYGDGGALYVTILPSDLRAGHFTRLCAELQQS